MYGFEIDKVNYVYFSIFLVDPSIHGQLDIVDYISCFRFAKWSNCSNFERCEHSEKLTK